ncbi:hypothetical protein SAMN02927937_02919 [Paenimyroides aquimaris]|uniref:Uncharacterized protein n=1 Tax=Paenimyroides marinum TaxID=1159016 RepID=A0A1H6N296_9FLAO|nr:hypothetical protein [Paenimyroides aquimaris]SEI04211.1 hypothetical protein SAMN02927937_02919 [Paenimyroides aquimaris]
MLSHIDTTTYAKSIYVDQDNVYIVGYTDAIGERSFKLWKNGVPTKLISGERINRGLDLTVENENVYAAGYEQVGDKYVPRVFKNNELLPIQHTASGHTYAFAVQVVDEKVYVLGSEYRNGKQANIIWENGKEIDFLSVESGYSEFQSMIVVPKE